MKVFTMKDKFTSLQGQYLAFIYYYTKIHGCAPSEAELERYFKVAYSSVHQMILTLEKRGLITRRPGEARSIRLSLPREEIPDLK
ncbi:LexA family protein [Chloroflexota bacterium]